MDIEYYILHLTQSGSSYTYSSLGQASIIPFISTVLGLKEIESYTLNIKGQLPLILLGGYGQKKTFRHGEEKPPLLLEVTCIYNLFYSCH